MSRACDAQPAPDAWIRPKCGKFVRIKLMSWRQILHPGQLHTEGVCTYSMWSFHLGPSGETFTITCRMSRQWLETNLEFSIVLRPQKLPV
ncbi:hypothetical protein PoB_004246800 [Plakobranchus ocellatus]|uniref:Uncharacterized protein n=1 Tax=Plakobranchus ocellatus TaxID=259542 RepID=A0AAV4B9Y8_9GAST|nr:hypothetical protein PoB_004246800 [Plakobranchus ocellatus]